MSGAQARRPPIRIAWETRARPPAVAEQPGGLASKRIIVGYGFWIFLLSDIIMFSAFFATYAVLVGRHGGRAERRRICSICATSRIETGCLLLSSFTCGLASIGARTHSELLVLSAAMAVDLRARRRVSRPGDPRVRGHGRAGRRPDAQRVPVGLLHAGRLPRAARHRRPAVAADDDGAGRSPRDTAPTSCAACSASACSGTRWTSSGWRCSPWSI